jgi:Flp pilus assembly protein TadD
MMLDTEAFREFKQGLTLLRDNYAIRALPHMQKAMDLDKNNPYYMSYLGVVLARSERKWGEAERLCDAAVRMKRNQAQLYLNLAEVYATAGRRDEAVEALQAGLKFARRDVRLSIALNRLMHRREPVFSFLSRRHPVNRQLGRLRHRALQMFTRS